MIHTALPDCPPQDNASEPLLKNHVTVVGNPTAGRTLLFGHGFGTDQTAWAQVAAAFAADYRIVLYDLVGSGKSSPLAWNPDQYDSLHAYACDLLDICAALDLSEVTLVGHSMSAMISLLAAAQEPRHFSGLVLVGGSPRFVNDQDYHGGFDQAELDTVFQSMQNSYHAWISGFAPLAMANPDQPRLAEYFADTLRSIRPDIALAVLRVAMLSDHRAELAKVSLPNLIIQSRDDFAVPLAVAEYLHQQIAGSHLEVVDATGHLPHVSAPATVISALRGFLSRTFHGH